MYEVSTVTNIEAPLAALRRACAIPSNSEENDSDLSAMWNEQIAYIEQNSALILRPQTGTLYLERPESIFLSGSTEKAQVRFPYRSSTISVESATYYNGTEDTELDVSVVSNILTWAVPTDLAFNGPATIQINLELEPLDISAFIDPISRIVALCYLRGDSESVQSSVNAILKSISVGL